MLLCNILEKYCIFIILLRLKKYIAYKILIFNVACFLNKLYAHHIIKIQKIVNVIVTSFF